MTNFRLINILGIIMLLSATTLFSCTKEVGSGELIERNGLMYEVNSDKPFSGKSFQYYKNGQQQEITEWKYGETQGVSKSWYENGQQETITVWKDGELHGTSKIWYETGQQQGIDEYKYGELNGISKSWFENGQQQAFIENKDGQRHGISKFWYESGQQENEGSFQKGKLQGIYKSWDENGLLTKANFKDDEMIGLPTIKYPDGSIGKLTDIDGNVYQTVYIGDQIWMRENLRVTHYRDGTPIPKLTDDRDWMQTSNGAYCYYGNHERPEDIYGALYNWHAVADNHNIAPEGWHVPTDDDWYELQDYLSENGHSGQEGAALRYTTAWKFTDEPAGIPGTDDYVFAALPSGTRKTLDDIVEYDFRGIGAFFWSASEADSSHAWFRMLFFYSSEVERTVNPKSAGFAVRLVQD